MNIESRFSKYLSRFNSLMGLIGGILLICVLLYAGYMIADNMFANRDVRNIVNVQTDGDLEEEWQIGYMSSIQGTPYVMIPLNSDQRYAQSYYSKSASSVRNYLFIDGQNNERHWLFDTNEYLVIEMDLLSVGNVQSDKDEVRAILYRIVKADTNGDERLTHEDMQSIGLSSPDGKRYKEILVGIDRFIGHRLMDEKILLLVFQRKETGFSANVDLAAFEVYNETELPKVGSETITP